MSDIQSSLPIRTETNGDVVAKLADGTTPSQLLAIDAAGKIEVKLDDAAGTGLTSQVSGSQQALDVGINVAGVQVDPRSIRALTSSDEVTADQGTAAATAGAWPTKLTDGTNVAVVTAAGELQVDITQPLPAGTNNIGKIELTDGTNTAAVTASSALKVDGSAVTQPVSGTVAVTQSTSPWVVDIADIAGSAPSASNALPAQLATGGAYISPSNPLPVTIDPASAGTPVMAYKDASAIAGGASDNHDYTVTALKTLYLQAVEASSSGKMKMLLAVETGVATGTFTPVGAQFNSTATPNARFELTAPLHVAAGVRVRVTMTNREVLADDLYSTIMGYEI